MSVKRQFRCRRCGEIFLGYAWEKHDCGYQHKVTNKDCNGEKK